MHQYYEIEQTTDLWSFNTGRVQKKMGVNQKEMPARTPVSFVILDNHHLMEHGVVFYTTYEYEYEGVTYTGKDVFWDLSPQEHTYVGTHGAYEG